MLGELNMSDKKEFVKELTKMDEDLLIGIQT